MKRSHIALALALIAVLGSLLISDHFGIGAYSPLQVASAEDLPKLDTNTETAKIHEELRRLFPQGTPKKYVEDVLTGSGAAIEPHEIRSNVFLYNFPSVGPMSDARAVTVMYDAKDTVRQIHSTSEGAIFPETPPTDRSDRMIFTFDDYDSADDLVETLRTMFALYTPRAEVEKVLVKWAGAKLLTEPEEPHHATYSFRYDAYILKDGRSIPEPRVWNVKTHYNKDDTLSQFLVDGSRVLRAYAHDREYYIRQYKKSRQDDQNDEGGSKANTSE